MNIIEKIETNKQCNACGSMNTGYVISIDRLTVICRRCGNKRKINFNNAYKIK